MHAILARDTDDPAFAPETATGAITAQWAEQAEQQLEAAFAALDAQSEWDEAAARDLAAVMAGARCAGRERAHACARAGNGATLTRIHGDLHLGQVLVANGDVFIIDFEGEPAKPMEARRAKNHRLRDVAGMIRSFDYAAAVVKRKSVANQAHVTDPVATRSCRRSPSARRSASSPGTATRSRCRMQPRSGTCCDLFLIEKAAYEIVYEAANRPAWIDVPLHGLARIDWHRW